MSAAFLIIFNEAKKIFSGTGSSMGATPPPPLETEMNILEAQVFKYFVDCNSDPFNNRPVYPDELEIFS